jgi:hypothetical protein
MEVNSGQPVYWSGEVARCVGTKKTSPRIRSRRLRIILSTIEQPSSGKTEFMGEDQLYEPPRRKPYPVTEINPPESLAERLARRLQPEYPN